LRDASVRDSAKGHSHTAPLLKVCETSQRRENIAMPVFTTTRPRVQHLLPWPIRNAGFLPAVASAPAMQQALGLI
jgi:hypothetical protein